MKKITVLFLLLIFMLAACKQPNLPSNNESDTILDNVDSSVISVPQNTDAIEANSSATEEDFFAPYTMIEISDERIKISNNKKVFSDLGITFSFPVDWIGMELNAEDLSSYSFRHPKFENARFDYSKTGAAYLYDVPNEDEYIKELPDNLENLRIHSFMKNTLSGYECTKVVYSYTSEDTEFIHINYEYVIVGFSWYTFSIKYPSAQSETYEGVFESIVNSIVIKD
ncbi:MAG: hypothetical protein IJD71_00620 [Clostridia bacterium]|nr:hypothetical protein [Clostridia bacterium]MBQ4130826.1 hypothetical protein [Clostridia bacterium]